MSSLRPTWGGCRPRCAGEGGRSKEVPRKVLLPFKGGPFKREIDIGPCKKGCTYTYTDTYVYIYIYIDMI